MLTTAVWSYLLVFGKSTLSRRLLYGSYAAVVMSLLVAQERNGGVAFLLVTMAFLVSRTRFSAVTLRAAIVAILFLPILAQRLFEIVARTGIGSSFIGTTTVQRNVVTRIQMI